MTVVRLFDMDVRRRLDAWGREFCLAREFIGLGYRGKNLLQVLIEHQGEMPPRVTGFKPEEVTADGWLIESMVHDLHETAPDYAKVLRAYYCGSGRVKVERYALAQRLCAASFSVRQYFVLHDLGFSRIAGMLQARSRSDY